MPEPPDVIAPRFDLEQCRSSFEAAFINALHIRAEAELWYADAWPRDDRLIISADVTDAEANCVLRTLRVDIFENSVIVGPDATYQLASDLDSSLPGVHRWSDEPPAVLANRAADWLKGELSRRIERHEWFLPTFRHRKWVLADSGEPIIESDSQNRRRSDLGPPSRITVVWPGQVGTHAGSA